MKKSLIYVMFIGMLSIMGSAYAAEVGIGASIGGGELNAISIDIPINISKDFRIQPFFSYYEYDTDYEGGSAFSDSTYSYYEVGTGLYRLLPQADKVNVFVGARVGYVQMDGDSDSSGSEGDGYSLAPELGIEYYVTDQFSVGVSVGVTWQSISVDADDGDSYDQTSTNSFGRINLKHYF